MKDRTYDPGLRRTNDNGAIIINRKNETVKYSPTPVQGNKGKCSCGKSKKPQANGAGKLLPAGVQANGVAIPTNLGSAGKPEAKQPVANSKVEPLLPAGVGRDKPQANETKDKGTPPHMAPAGVDINPQ